MNQNQQHGAKMDSQAKAQEILNRERKVNQNILRLKATEESYVEEYQRLVAQVEQKFGTSNIDELRAKYKDKVSEEAQQFSLKEKELAEAESLVEYAQRKLNELNGA